MTTLFISDLHLDAVQPEIGEQFVAFLGSAEARAAEALYILGDLFESWIGDDDDDPYRRSMVAALADYRQTGVAGYFMHGNRDFMIGADFGASSGFELLPEAIVVDLYGNRVLLMHGDQLCTDDHEYQAFRSMVRQPQWQQQMLELPLAQRRQIASQARAASNTAGQQKSMDIMDVNADAVTAVLREHDVDTLLHGHTHRPAIHTPNGTPGTRIVLGDWYSQGSVLRWDAAGYSLDVLPR